MFFNRTQKPRNRKAFTLAEVMVVLVIIGLLAGVIGVNVRSYLVKGRQKAAKVDISRLSEALESFYALTGRYPTNDEGLEILTKPSEKMPEPPLKANQKLTDPWGNPYQYNCPGEASNPYEVISYGADGREGGEGGDSDIFSWDLKE